MKLKFTIVSLLLSLASLSGAPKNPEEGAVSGSVVSAAADRPVEYGAVTLKSKADGKTLRATVTDAKGAFTVGALPFGEYEVVYGAVGGDTQTSRAFTVDAAHRTVDLGRLLLGAETPVQLGKVEVAAHKEAFYNSIDRKVYNVGKDIQSVAGSASDLLQNVPSVQVDIEGNVALRGDSNVLILINGKTSTMMGKNRAAVLEQMPADGIEKIEVITNPSAKYKPDGTAGIINLTMKKKQEPGYSGSVRAVVGNDRRYNASVTANYNPGKYNLFATAGVRQDNRPRTVTDERSRPGTTPGTVVATSQHTTEASRPLSRVVQTGVDYKLSDATKVGASMHYNYRDFFRTSTVSTRISDPAGTGSKDYDRQRRDPEYEKDLEFTGTLQHSFPQEDRELNFELRHGKTTEQEDNRYANVYRLPAIATAFENTLIKNTETSTEGTAEYVHPLNEDAKLEAGYNGQGNRVDLDYHGSFFNPATQVWQEDLTRTNRFIYDATIHATYATYAQKLGQFGFLAGLRFEQAIIRTDQRTARLRDKNDYNRFYPSLHLSYNFTEAQQVQLNYSHRVHRPEGDDLNPFPQYQDPLSLRAGNPRLRPEEIHSVESGYQYKNGDTSYLATVYYRYRYNGMTDVTRYVDSLTLLPSPNGATTLTTKENLGRGRSGGLELGTTTRLKDRVSLNFSSNIYRSEIDAGNLGFSARRSTVTWDAKLNASWDITKSTLVQLNTNYTAKRLTPQGYRYPTYVANLGLRHNFNAKKTAFVLTVSDVFNSLKERSLVDTPTLHEQITRRRSSRLIFAGFIYNFGKAGKKSKDDTLPFDNSL